MSSFTQAENVREKKTAIVRFLLLFVPTGHSLTVGLQRKALPPPLALPEEGFGTCRRPTHGSP